MHFLGKVPEGVDARRTCCIEGGRRIRGIQAIKVEIDRADDPELDDCLRITLDRSGDFSTYRLCLVEKVGPAVDAPMDAQRSASEVSYRPLSGIDPRYACVDFSFKVDCPSDLDCKQRRLPARRQSSQRPRSTISPRTTPASAS